MKGMMIAVVVVVAVITAGCGKDGRGMSRGQIKDLWTQASDKEYIRVRGIGAAPEGVKDLTRRRGLARNAALVAGRYELLQVMKGLTLTGGLTVGSLMQTHGEIRELADRVVAGAEEVQTEFGKDDGCVVLMELRRDKVERIIQETSDYESPAAHRARMLRTALSGDGKPLAAAAPAPEKPAKEEKDEEPKDEPRGRSIGDRLLDGAGAVGGTALNVVNTATEVAKKAAK